MREANAIFLFINVNDNSKHSRNSSASLSPQSHPISLSLLPSPIPQNPIKPCNKDLSSHYPCIHN